MVDRLPNLQQVYAKWERKGVGSSRQQPRPAGGEAADTFSQGKQAWLSKFGSSIGAPPPRRFNNRRRFQREPVSVQLNLGEFKTYPSIIPNYSGFQRPFMGRCCSCLPKSHGAFFDPEVTPSMGIRSIFNVPTSSQNNGILVQLFSHIVFTARQPVDFKYPNVRQKVLSSQRIFTAAHLTVRKEFQDRTTSLTQKSFTDNMKKCKKKAEKILSNMQAVMRLPLIKFTGWFLLKVLGLLLDSIQVHNGQLHMLQMAAQEAYPVIYIPLHRSHMDYVLMTFILWNYNLRGPYVAAGENLNIPFFGPLLRSLGGFFIRRRLDRQDGEKDILYRAVLQQYVEELLRAGQAIEFFIEGGRTRSGKALSPKAGLLSIVVEALNGGAIHDAYIVPVSISYEKILDGNFNREQLGLPKVRESFWRTVKGLWRVFTSTYGNVRVDFGQPFSLKEYINRFPPVPGASRNLVEKNGIGSRYSLHNAVPRSNDDEGWCEDEDGMRSNGSPNSVTPPILSLSPQDEFRRISSATSMTSIYGVDESDDQKAFINRLAKHVIYNCVSSSAIMSTNLLAFVFVFLHRQGATLEELVCSFDSVRDDVAAAGRDVGFRGSSSDIIAHAIGLIGDALVTLTDAQGNELKRKSLAAEQLKCARIVPALHLPSVFEWTYYSNPVISVFEKESILANAIWASVESDLTLTLDDPSSADDDDIVTIDADAVLEKAASLCGLLQYEFFFRPPCAELETVLEEVLDCFVTKEIVLPYGSNGATASEYSRTEQQWALRFSSSVSWEDDDESGTGRQIAHGGSGSREYFLNVTKTDCMRRLQFYRKLLLPYIEAYWFIISSLAEQLKDKDVPEEDFVLEMQAALTDRVKKGLTDYSETASHDVLRNVLRAVDKLDLTDTYTAAGVRMVTLHDRHQSEERLLASVGLLQDCRS